MPSSDLTLEEYFTVLRETEKRLQKMGTTSRGSVDYSTLKRPDTPVTLDDQVEAMLDVMAMALWTESKRGGRERRGKEITE